MRVERHILHIVCVVLCFVGCSVAAAESAESPRSAEEADKVLAAMRKELGGKFRYRKVRCFVAASDASATRFRRTCHYTLGKCYDAYRKQFFDKGPKVIYRVYLVRDAVSYKTHTKKLFGTVPSTPFGYYSDTHHALVMNIGTGGGTLVHEMFHALVKPDFPDIPAWANEGIASLFEQCNITPRGLVGLVNWRLPILQKAIRSRALPSLRKIMMMSDAEFYRARGGNYAAARYFFLYLQKKGVLVDFYKKFRDNFKRDKTGVTFAEEVLGKKLEQVEPVWRKWVMSLRR